MELTQEIKEFLEHGGKVLVLEEGQPKFVISVFGDYMNTARQAHQKNVENKKAFVIGRPEGASWADAVQKGKIEEINREIEEVQREDFFSPVLSGQHDVQQTPTGRFYRELE
ncbi:MAG: hypothetical protein Q7S09_00695 [bacterium]|nr:hypothetical protein [bacterium]